MKSLKYYVIRNWIRAFALLIVGSLFVLFMAFWLSGLMASWGTISQDPAFKVLITLAYVFILAGFVVLLGRMIMNFTVGLAETRECRKLQNAVISER